MAGGRWADEFGAVASAIAYAFGGKDGPSADSLNPYRTRARPAKTEAEIEAESKAAWAMMHAFFRQKRG